jgi:nitrite reductase (NO-forming)
VNRNAALAMSLAFALTLQVSCGSSPDTASPPPHESGVVDPIEGQELARVASPPAVPPPISRTYATKVVMDVEVREHTGTLADGVDYLYFTYGDQAPGQFYRVRQGDLIEVHLHNHPDNSLAHSIDFQGATGPTADASFVAPGYTRVFAWRALRPGLFLYTGAAPPAAVQVASGMFGLILVEPRGGLTKVDREYQIVQSEFYTEGTFDERGAQRFSAEKARREAPEYVVFNGRVGALTGRGALTAAAGEKVRLFFGNAGPNLASSFHVSGESFDSVSEGAGALARRDLSTVLVPAGGTATLDLGAEVPGDYAIVDRSLSRSDTKGAAGLLTVTGGTNRLVFSGATSLAPYEPGTHLTKLASFTHGAHVTGPELYATICATCHQANALGIPKAFPPLRESDFLARDRKRAIRIVMSGLRGPIVVNGAAFDGVMPNPNLDDEQIASVLGHVMTSFGNHGTPVSVGEVSEVRKAWDGVSPLVAAEGAPPPRVAVQSGAHEVAGPSGRSRIR